VIAQGKAGKGAVKSANLARCDGGGEMKIFLAIALAFGLSSCASSDFFGETTSDQAPPPPPPSASVQTTTLPPTASAPAAAPPSSLAPSSVGSTAPEVSTSQAPVSVPVASPPMPSASEPPAVTAARYAPTPNAAVSYHCKNLAKLRAGDAAFQGEDPDTQKAVYDSTYRDCVAWDAAHRS